MTDEIMTQSQAEQASYPAAGSREMIEAGVFYGRKKSKTNPKMRQFILADRAGIEIIDLEKTATGLERAIGFVREKVKNGGLVFLVGTQPAVEESILALAKRFSLPYVSFRWVGGTITNFKIISGRVAHLKKLREGLATGALDKYTKKERLDMEREVKRLEELMGGLEDLPREPDLMIIIDPNLHTTAVREAVIKKIPVVALANVDADPDVINYLVPGNDKAKMSVEWFLKKMENAIEEGFAARPAPKEVPSASAGNK
jgi:small subunit ribosomal protein S2